MSNAAITFDLSSGVIPEYKDQKPDDVRRKSLNFLLNMTSRSPDLLKVAPEDIKDGKISIPGSDLKDHLDIQAIKRFERELTRKTGARANPYACFPREENTYRTDYLASLLTDPEAYYAAAGIPATYAELARKLKLKKAIRAPQDMERDRNPNKIVAPRSKITIGEGPRVLFWEEMDVKRTFYGSTDFPLAKRGLDRQFGDITKLKGKAGEFIFSLPNGFHSYALYGADGSRQNVAPADVVQNVDGIGPSTVSSHSDPAIRAPFDCMRCHNGGLRGGSQKFELRDFLAARKKAGLVDEDTIKAMEEFWTTNQAYQKQRTEDNQVFREALETADAYIPIGAKGNPGDDLSPGYPLAADLAAVYEHDLNLGQIARELGLKPAELKKALSSSANVKWRERLNFKDGKITDDYSISRETFSQLFCDLKKTLIRQRVIRPSELGTEPRPDDSGPIPVPQPNHTPITGRGDSGGGEDSKRPVESK